eukprot:13074974-Ditylum_brightwellii.AAC.1
MSQGLILGQSQVQVKQALAYSAILLKTMRHSPIHRRMNFKSDKRKSPSHPSCKRHVDITKEEGEGTW